ncbi:hypothetical protein SAMN02745752_02841 [Marinospirillum alkaliphilum DSM 21637]|uniref:Uncharacterized protein n=1 Tax=Marinospirillum alkaliphilum DSM 21637 TaxID=1122209 RepID=A0A1K1ZUQ9_9GAMM|nr:hypothetical protein SAMN02745752_02841 [Marinospirillum alkaliphilum DSM 21637]
MLGDSQHRFCRAGEKQRACAFQRSGNLGQIRMYQTDLIQVVNHLHQHLIVVVVLELGNSKASFA